jgi:transposase InsO family protein
LKSSSKSTNVGDPCLARLGRKTVENKILKDAVDFFSKQKSGFSARLHCPGTSVRAVCQALRLSLSHLSFKRGCAKLAHRPDSQTVMEQLKAWFDDYKPFRPHSALGYWAPQLFRKRRSAT